MKTALVILGLLALFVTPGAQAADPPPYSQLDVRPFDPAIDPDIDMFISDYREGVPYQEFGALIVRDIFTKGTGDPMKPEKRGACLQFVERLSFARLQGHQATTPAKLDKSQIIFYFSAGEGIIEAGDQRAEIRSGVGVFMPANLEFVIANTGGDPVEMYMIVEPLPAGLVPVPEMLVRDERTIPIGTTKSHWSHILRVFFYGDDFRKRSGVVTGMCPVWFDPLTMGQPHSHGPGVEEVWFVVEGEPVVLLGKELRRLKPGMAYKIPPNGTTPHSNINTTDEMIKLVWFMKY